MRTAIGERQLLATIPYVTGPLADNNAVGTMRACVSRTTNASANTDTDFPHELGRTPNGYIVLRSAKGGVLYDASDGAGHWSASNIRLRSTVASDTVSFLVW